MGFFELPSRPVLTILFVAVATMFVISSVEWTLLPYLNHTNSTTSQTTHYLILSSFPLFMPLLANIALGHLSSHFTAPTTLASTHVLVAVGISLFFISPTFSSRLIIAYMCYSIISSLRVLRVAILADMVSTQQRTAILAWHFFMAPLGALLGPFLWIFVQKWQGAFIISSSPAFVFDRFTVLYAICAVLMFAVAIVVYYTRHSFAPIPQPPSLVNKVQNYGSVQNVLLNDESNAQHRFFSRNRLLWFIALMLPVRMSLTIITAVFQPALIDHFALDEAQVASVYSFIAVAALLPPILIVSLSNHLSDRTLLLIGLIMKGLGSILYLPVFGPVRPWAIICGFVVFVKASAFFTTAVLSLFTKIITNRKDRVTMLGYLWAICNGFPALLQVSLSRVLMTFFGKWSFAFFILPIFASLALVLHSSTWRVLNPESDLNSGQMQ